MIELQGLYDRYKVRAAQTSTNARPAVKDAIQESPTRGENQDVIQISPHAELRAQLSAATNVEAQQFQEGITPERMAYLKTKYAGDACPVEPEQVANAMLNRLAGSL